MMSEAVRIADKVMAYLRAKKDNTLFLDAHCEGETFPFALARLRKDGKDTVIVGLRDSDDDAQAVLVVDLYMLGDGRNLVADKQLADQVLHKVVVFDKGKWCDVLQGALHVDEFAKWEQLR